MTSNPTQSQEKNGDALNPQSSSDDLSVSPDNQIPPTPATDDSSVEPDTHPAASASSDKSAQADADGSSDKSAQAGADGAVDLKKAPTEADSSASPENAGESQPEDAASAKTDAPKDSRKKVPEKIKLFKTWLQASRAPFFIATIFPLALGFTAAYKDTGEAKVGLFILILLASFLVHLATNLANDYFDYSLGVDTKDSIGGSRVIQEESLSPSHIRRAIAICYVVAFILAIFIVGKNVALWVVVLLAALSSFFYVAPPIKYGHRALGELSVFVNMGLFMTIGTQAALTGSFLRTSGALALPISFMVACILYFQSLPEIETDAKAGKVTLAGILGKDRAFLVYLLWWPVVWLLMIALYLSKLVEWPALLGLLSLPLHVAACRRFKTVKDWLELDKYGHLIRKLYVFNGFTLILGLACN
jgi:1,4-dihydroxy-2-naphthoate octaprenyltransferase